MPEGFDIDLDALEEAHAGDPSGIPVMAEPVAMEHKVAAAAPVAPVAKAKKVKEAKPSKPSKVKEPREPMSTLGLTLIVITVLITVGGGIGAYLWADVAEGGIKAVITALGAISGLGVSAPSCAWLNEKWGG